MVQWMRLAMSGLLLMALASCRSNDDEVRPTPGNGALYVLIKDAPACNVLSMHFRISVLTIFAKVGDEFGARAVPEAQLTRVNLGLLRDFNSVLSLVNLPEGTYEEVEITLSLPQLALYDGAEDPPVKLFNPALMPNNRQRIRINPPLRITANELSVLLLDIDLLRSIQLDENGQANGTFNPIISLSELPRNQDEGFGELHNLMGFVRTVSPFSPAPGSDFTGSFSLQLHGGTGVAVSVNLTEDTQLFGADALNLVETGRFVEVNAFIDSRGNIVARTIEVEERAFVEQNRVAFIGTVTGVTRDDQGALTEFRLHVQQEEPDVSLTVALDSSVLVQPTEETEYRVSARGANFADLTFSPDALTVGQQVVVHGKFTRAEGQPTTVEPTRIYLKLQAHQGNFNSLVRAESDGRSGAFWFRPCSTVWGGNPLLAFTTPETAFVNTFGITSLQQEPSLLVTGLPFVVKDATTINGVDVPAGTTVLLGRQVHQLE
jgi:hypothetical protein